MPSGRFSAYNGSTMTQVTLSRQLRFGLHSEDVSAAAVANGFAGHPALLGLAPFLTLTAGIRGQVDDATGMLVNIKQIDQTLREQAAPMVRAYYYGRQPEQGSGGGGFASAAGGYAGLRICRRKLVTLELGLSPYLSLCVDRKEPTVAQISQRFEFSAAHRLHSGALSAEENRRVFGKCNNPNGHGHNYELEVTVTAVPAAETGVVFPVEELQRIVHARVVSVFDHKHLNLDCAEFQRVNPTVENIARVIFEALDGAFVPARLKRVRVWETPKTMCEYDGA